MLPIETYFSTETKNPTLTQREVRLVNLHDLLKCHKMVDCAQKVKSKLQTVKSFIFSVLSLFKTHRLLIENPQKGLY